MFPVIKPQDSKVPNGVNLRFSSFGQPQGNLYSPNFNVNNNFKQGNFMILFNLLKGICRFSISS